MSPSAKMDRPPGGAGSGYVITFGDTDTSRFVRLLKNAGGVEVRVRKMQ